MHTWFESWFYKLETEKEFLVSMKKFKKFYRQHKQVLGNTYCMHIDNLVNDCNIYLDMVCHHKHMGKTKFSFNSSSICEGGNFSLKYGVYKIKATHSIHISGTNQIKQVEAKTRRDNVKLARNVHSSKLWSKLPSMFHLSDYIEGLVCNMADTSDYEVIYRGNLTWLVYHSSILHFHTGEVKQSSDEDSQVVKYDRVRTVTVDGSGYMTCDCGGVDDFLAPCRHCIAVLLGPSRDISNISPLMFAPRYWELLNYYFMTDFGKELVPHLYKEFSNVSNEFYTNSFNRNGKFKGILVPFNVNICSEDYWCSYSSGIEIENGRSDVPTLSRNIALALQKCIEENGVCIRGSKEYEKFMPSPQRDNNEVEEEEVELSSDDDLGMGGLSQSDYQLSEHEHVMRDDMDTHETDVDYNPGKLHSITTVPTSASEWMKQGSDIQNALSEAASMCQCQEHSDELQMLCSNFIAQCTVFTNKIKGEKNHSKISDGQTTFYGEFDNNSRSNKRHRANYERFL